MKIVKNLLIKLLKSSLGTILIPVFANPLYSKGKTYGYLFNRVHKSNLIQGKYCNISIPYNISDVTIDSYTYISPNSHISHTQIGKFCSIGPNLFCGWGIHPINGISTSPSFYSIQKQNGVTFTESNKVVEREKITIGNDVFIGANVTILDGITIGDGAIIGAGAVVVKSIPPYAVAVGVPAKVVKYRFSDEIIQGLLKIKWWNFDSEKLKEIEKYFFNVNEFIEKNKL